MWKGHVRKLLPPIVAYRAATQGDPVGWCDRGCTYGHVDAVHIQVRGNRAFLTVQCRRCRLETVLPWLTRDSEGRWKDPYDRPCLADPAKLQLPSVIRPTALAA